MLKTDITMRVKNLGHVLLLFYTRHNHSYFKFEGHLDHIIK
jgi:hypothetical protein